VSAAVQAPVRRRVPGWLVALIAVGLAAALLVVGLIRLGLLTFAGTAPPTVRYEAAQPGVVSTQWSFDDLRAGGFPPTSVVFGEPLFGGWSIRIEADAPSPPNALCQTGIAEFPALTLGQAIYRDLSLAVRFKPVSGRVDQAAGVIFRVQDDRNYYVLRANALERNVNFYRYSGGRRSPLAEGPVDVASGRWQTLRVDARGSDFSGYLDERLVVTASDSTFPAGQIGLWTKADAHTCFDDIEVRPL
jgi:hypothetical protein